MSRVSKWKIEKAKVKVVFRLQFHATHVPQAGWDKLFISFIPCDSGKATAKTTKANVRNGTCKWADPIYETTRLLYDSRSKRYDEKLCQFVVAMGSSRSSILGEAIINLADYTDALKPSIVALPLQGCSSGTLLHVTVQLLTSKTGFREFEQQRELRERGLQTGVDINSRETRDGSERVSSSEDIANDETEKVNARVKSRPEPKELPSLEEETDSPMGFDGSSNTSGSLYAEKNDNSSINEIDSLNYSVDNDLAISHEENNRLKGCLELAESTISELNLELASLRNNANEIGIETQKFSQKISAEISSSVQLAEEISVMKFECSNLKKDLQQLTSLQSTPRLDNFYKGLFTVEEKIRQIQRKVYLSLDDREARLIHLDFEALLNILLELKQEKLPSEIAKNARSGEYLQGNGLDVDLFHPPDMLHCLLPQEQDSLIATKAMEDKMFELLRELDGSKIEKEGMLRKMNEMECYYEALVLELEENQKQMLVELQNIRNENSTCLYSIATKNLEIESIRRETDDQILRFSQERNELDLICKELEKRAISSETALKRARLNYSIAVDQLQKDLDLLSFQVLSMFQTNETLIRKTWSEFHSQNKGIKKQVMGGDVLLEDMKKSLLFQEALYHKIEEELSEMYASNIYLDIFSKVLRESLVQASSEIILMETKIAELVHQLDLSAESKRLLNLQLQSTMNELAQQNKMLGLKSENFANENFLFSEKISQLEVMLRDCSAEKAELTNLMIQENVSKENLQKEMLCLYEELEFVKGEKSNVAHCNEKLQKLVNLLEEKLGSMLESLIEKPNGMIPSENTESRDLESVGLITIVSRLEETQRKAYEKTRQLMEEKKTLEDETERDQLLLSTAKSEVVSVQLKLEGELHNVGTKLEDSNSLVKKLQIELETLGNKLQICLETEEKYVNQNRELLAQLADLEGELQQLMSKNIDLDKEILGIKTVKDELRQELTISLERKDADNANLASELHSLKGNIKFLHNELDLERSSKENLTSLLNDKNQQLVHFAQLEAEFLHVRKRALNIELQLENLANKLRLSLEAEEKYENQDKMLLDSFSLLENGLLDLTSKNMELGQEISRLNTVSEELGMCKLTLSKLTREREDLTISSQNTGLEISRLEYEIDILKKKLKFLQDESDTEKRSKDDLHSTIDHLTFQLNEKNEEVVILRQRSSDLEREKKNLEDEREQAQALSCSTSSEILVTKQKYKQEIRNMSAKLEASNTLVEKLELELENLANKFQSSSEAEEKYAKENEDLLANLSLLEGDLQELASKNTELAENIFFLNAVTEELETCKLTLVELAQEKQNSTIILQKKDVVIVNLKSELDGLKDSKENIEHVTFQLNEKKNQLLRFSQQEDELGRFRQLASDLECEIFELHGYLISSDIKLIFMEFQYDMVLEKQLRELEVKVSEKLPVFSEQQIDCVMSSDLETNIFIIILKDKLNELKGQFNGELAKLQRKCDELNNRLLEQVLKTEEFKNLSTHLKELKDNAESERESLRIVFIKEQFESKVQELKHQVSISSKHAEDMLLKLQDSVDELENAKRSEAAQLKRNEELSIKVSELEAEMMSIVSEKKEKIKAYDLVKAELECALLSLEYCKEEKELNGAYLKESRDKSHSKGVEESIINGEGITEEGQDLIVYNLQVPQNGHGIPDIGADKYAVINHRAKIESLKSSMDHLQQQLERMKNENSLIPHEDQRSDASVLDLETELLQLKEANEELRTRFPLFDELPGNGNALERVFALEVELAEALQAKNKSNVLLQSSFLKQHGDEQAIFQSFRDINELIKEMLELKGKHTSMERELNEMHDRYSQLSLQLAEVEGERQKLMMTLKNSRSSNKFSLFNRSASATLE